MLIHFKLSHTTNKKIIYVTIKDFSKFNSVGFDA